MHWVLAKNLDSDRQYENLLTQLTRQDTPYTIVGVIPFSGEILNPNSNVRMADLGPDVFCCGKGSMKRASDKYGWTPGYIEAATYIECLREYGQEMLNYDSVIGTLGEVVPHEQRFFVRPNADDKSFNGQLMNKPDFLDWQRQMSAMEDSATITKDDIIILSPLKEIYAEYRFYVVNGEAVTGSLYKSRDTVVYKECIDERVMGYASDMAQLYSPSAAFVLDIADTPYGLRVLETNSISSSGFYAIDIGKFVNAINALGYN